MPVLKVYKDGVWEEVAGVSGHTHSVSDIVDFPSSANIVSKSFLGRTTAVNAADTNYTTLMARGVSLNSAETTPAVNGAIAWTYE